ncbi:hypothetical protein CMT66_16100 [Elizabethkingia anophelis]|nr:hypothetical protein [Elizabethkingia anophelis]
MINSITADRIANSILQRRKKYNNFILVEGSHDRLFLLKFINNDTQIEITFGWEKLIKVIEILRDKGYENIIGIVDLDFRDFITDEITENDETILIDAHDIDILCLEKSFPTIFNSYCSQEKLESFKQSKNCECIKQYTYEILKPLSYLKFLNKKESLNLTFKSNGNKKNNFDYSKFIDKSKYELINNLKLIETVTNFSRGKTTNTILKNEEILKKLETLLEFEKFPEDKITNGHDFGEAIAIGLKKVLGSKDLDSETFLKECILSYDSTEFIKTKLYKKIQNIQKKKKIEFLKL